MYMVSGRTVYLRSWLLFLCCWCSWRYRSTRCCWHSDFGDVQSCLYQRKTLQSAKFSQAQFHRVKTVYKLTFSRETKSAACSSVSPEISSTILLSFASPAPGGGAFDAGWASVARHLRANRSGTYELSEGDVERTFAGTWAREKRDVEIDLLQHEACMPEGLVKRFVTLWLCLIDHYYCASRLRHERGQVREWKRRKT